LHDQAIVRLALSLEAASPIHILIPSPGTFSSLSAVYIRIPARNK
jgi:hypothetical protein